jgi:hypothetical protein
MLDFFTSVATETTPLPGEHWSANQTIDLFMQKLTVGGHLDKDDVILIGPTTFYKGYNINTHTY